MKFDNSKKIYEIGKEIIPGGVNSPVRAFGSVGRDFPIFVNRGKGSKIYDEDGNEYIDYICSWGPLILGHNNERVLSKVREMIEKGSSFGLPTKYEIELAEKVIQCFPSMEMVRFTTSGTEATMAAVRLARAFTGRNKILKFHGCYHGHSDSLLVSSGSGLLTDGYQDSNGITEGVLKDTLVADFGNIAEVKSYLEERDVSAVILEPIPANMGLIETEKKFLEDLREVCTETGTLLIFDEVISGFRLALGGAQEMFNIVPDITTLGKIVGGGYPVGAFGGRREIMNMVAPLGRVYHAGTLSGNPVAVTAGIETISYLIENRETLYRELEEKTKKIADGIEKLGEKYGVAICVNRVGSLFTIFFTGEGKVSTLEDAKNSDGEAYNIYFNTLLENGVIAPPSKYEAHFVSAAHSDEDIAKTLEVIELAFEEISRRKK